ncbi:MAG: mandelate racemase [Defluviicoccus sp.]|nr:mandelate racemase [Defluviicoccus sp.]
MRILEVRETAIPVGASMANAAIGFDEMTASAVAVRTDRRVGGAPVIGYALDSVGRYAHGGLLRERFVPRLEAAAEAEIADPETGLLDPMRAWTVMMRNEKPGGHGERSAAVGVLDAALWDAAAKAAHVPLWRLLADRFNGGGADETVEIYASGGHYRPGEPVEALASEVRDGMAQGFRTFKIKVAGAALDIDRARIEAALDAVGEGGRIAVDANAALDRDSWRPMAAMLGDYDLAWFEEPCDPLDFELTREIASAYPGPLATGENLFSAADARNLLRYGGLRKDRDLLQFDVSLSYGIAEYLRIVDAAEQAGWSRRRLVPHAGHLFALNVVAGLGLGGHEIAPDASLVLGGLPDGCTVSDGRLAPGDLPGVGFEGKANAMAVLGALMG